MNHSRIAAAITAAVAVAGLSLGGAVAAQPAGAVSTIFFSPALYCSTHPTKATLTQSSGGVDLNGHAITNLSITGSCFSFNSWASYQFIDIKYKNLLSSTVGTVMTRSDGSFSQTMSIVFLVANSGICAVFTDGATRAVVSTC